MSAVDTSTTLLSDGSDLPVATPGIDAIWDHIVELGLVLLLAWGTITVFILLTRILRKKRPSNKISTRAKVERFLAYSRVGEWVEVSQAVISVISVGFFIYGTYITDPQAPVWYYVFELVFCVYFTLIWGLGYFLAKNKLRFLYSFFSFIDLVTVLPIYDDLLRGLFFKKELYTFQFLRVLRVIRIMRVNRVLHLFGSEITRHFFKAFVTIFTFILVVAGFYMNIESNSLATTDPLPPLKFHETVYFLVVTLTTVGYGDIHPTTAVGMITVTLVICIGAVLIPYQISVLTEKMSSYSTYNRDLSSTGITGHVICCGSIEYDSLLDFLLEFYHEKYGRLKKEVVVLSATEPSSQVKTLLDHPFYKRRLKFLVGDVLVDKAMVRTKFQKADGCFIFRPKNWEDGDADTVLAALALKNARKAMLVFPQVITANSRLRIPPNIKKFICMEETRSALLAQSMVCPGFSTMIGNLFTTRDAQANLTEPWLVEYSYGTINAINRFTIPTSLIGETLSQVIMHVYETMSALVIGIEEFSQDRKHVRVNIHPPLDTVLTAEMSLFVISRTQNAMSRYMPQATNSRALARASTIYLLQPEEEEVQKNKFNAIYKRLFVPDAEEVVTTNETDSLIDNTISASVEEKLIGLGPVGRSYGKQEDEDDEEMPSVSPVNLAHWQRGSPYNLPYSPPKLRRPDRLPVMARTDSSSSSDDMEMVESPTSVPKPFYAVLRNLCTTEFGGDWKAMLRGLIETLEKMDIESPEVVRIISNLKPLLFQQLLDDIPETFVPKKGHIVICGSLYGLDSFLKFYRLSSHTPIVVLSPTLPPDSVWQLSQTLPFISFIKGTPFDRRDLEKCHVNYASKIIILSDPYSKHESDAATDADALLAYFDMRNGTAANQILVEFVNESNLRFLQHFASQNRAARLNMKSQKNEEFRKPDYFMAPEFASGHVCTYTVVDSLMCQVYYKDYLDLVAQELIFGLNNLKSQIPSSKQSSFPFSTTRRQNYCYHIPVPPTLEGRTYIELLRHLLPKDILPMGLFRAKEMTRSPLPYVFTCPPDNTILHPLDKVIVITLTPPAK